MSLQTKVVMALKVAIMLGAAINLSAIAVGDGNGNGIMTTQ